MAKVLGVGWAKTGTTTLGDCLEVLGYRHCRARLGLVPDLATGDTSRALRLASEFDSFEDWPWLLLWREFDEAFPGSRFVLTVREPEQWIASYRNMLARQGEVTAEMNRIRRILYQLPFPDVTDRDLVARVQRHEREVRSWFSDRPGDLLVVDWAKGDGWEELCDFLGEPVPDIAFPHANRGLYED